MRPLTKALQLGTGWPLLWHALAVITVAMASPLVWLGVLPSRLPALELPQVVGIAGCYFAVAAYVTPLLDPRPRGLPLRPALASLLVFAGGYLALGVLPGVARSRGVFAVATATTAALVTIPVAKPRVSTALSTIALLVVSLATIALVRRRAPRPEPAWETGLGPVEIRTHSGLTGPPLGDGGGIARIGKEFLVVTGRGAFYLVRWNAVSVSTRRLPAPAPMNWSAYLADQPDTSRAYRLRVTGILIDTVGLGRVYVSHQIWHHRRRCFTLAVSTTTFAQLTAVDTASWTWERIFESHPCLPTIAGFDDIESGGRMAWTPERDLLLTVGDFGFDGVRTPDYPQDASTSYGKVLRRSSADGSWKRFTIGHRNPEGLAVDQGGRIWETEHGPRGGDELNVLVAGRNYGWPLVTYGTQYGASYWPLSPTAHDHGLYSEPAYAFVPSIGISSLIEVQGKSLPQWRGDLLVSSLKARSLWRIRRRAEHVIYAERIPIGRRIRDLAQDADGDVILWTDEGDLVTITSPRGPETPEMAYGQCRGCHEPALTGTALGPDLRGVFERRIAGTSGFAYSPALRHAGGTWTAERLDAFLRDPSGFAPGTKMTAGAVVDSARRRKVIEYLRTYH